VAPNAGCAAQPKGTQKVGIVVMQKFSAGWLVVAVAEVVSRRPKPLKPMVLLPVVAICVALERVWTKELAAVEVCRV
jgi:hypothetical protein